MPKTGDRMDTIRDLLAELTDGDARPSLGDYALAIGLIAVLAIVALWLFGDQTTHILYTVSGSV
jgi:hypothetical protein